ncbi:MAG TPA: DnaB-like helicase N-terminal domain-containing protein, partial [Leptolinea sp.]
MDDFPLTEEEPIADIQVQPHNRQAEEAVIGAVLINPDSFFELGQFLKPDDFYIVRNGWIWGSFTRLHEERIPIDFLTVVEDLEKNNQLVDAGGSGYLMALINQTPTSLHAETYGHMVEETAMRRRMLTSANDLARMAYDQQTPLDKVIDTAEKSIFAISERRTHKDVQPIKEALSDYYDRVDKLSSRSEEIYGVPTGLEDLDRLLGGLQKSDLLIIAG